MIIILYFLFPLLYRVIRWKSWIAILVSIAVMRISSHVAYDEVDLCTYQFPFVLGAVWQLYEKKGKMVQEWFALHSGIAIVVSISLLIMTIYIRMCPIIPHWNGTRIDGLVACAIALCVVTILRNSKYVMSPFAFLGRYSMNIYLMHTFINAYWFGGWLHSCEWLRGANLIVLLIICLMICICVEYIKDKIGLYKLMNILINRI